MILSEYSQQWTLEQADTIANLLIGAITAYKKQRLNSASQKPAN